MNIPQGNLCDKQKSPDIVGQTLRYLFKPGDVFEVCMIGPNHTKNIKIFSGFAGGKKAIVAGWFDDIEKAIEIIQKCDKAEKPTALYVSMNPVNPALLARASNRLQAGVNRTQDKEITEVRHMLIDADPIRPAGISSTTQEKKAAIELLRTVNTDLKALGWDEPLVGDSGNGGHLIYPVDIDCTGLIPDFLKTLDHKYSTSEVNIDTTVGNPARLVKVYGTVTRKGDSTQDRPHRRATILSLPREAE